MRGRERGCLPETGIGFILSSQTSICQPVLLSDRLGAYGSVGAGARGPPLPGSGGRAAWSGEAFHSMLRLLRLVIAVFHQLTLLGKGIFPGAVVDILSVGGDDESRLPPPKTQAKPKRVVATLCMSA